MRFGSTFSSTELPPPVEKQPKTKRGRPSKEKSAAAKPIVLKKSGMNYPTVLSNELRQFLGEEMMIRAEIVTKFSQYIKDNNLYSPHSKKYFRLDSTLSELLGKTGEYKVLHVQRLLKPHLTPPAANGKDYEERADAMFQKYLQDRGAINSQDVVRQKDPRGLNSLVTQKELHSKGLGMYAPVQVPPHIRPICKGKAEMSRPRVIKSVWDYIKKNKLQDSKARRTIHLDDGLRQALQVTDRESLDAFELPKYVWKQMGRTVKR